MPRPTAPPAGEGGTFMRFACDVGGTFTDLILEDGPEIRLYKSSTTPDDPVRGLFEQ